MFFAYYGMLLFHLPKIEFIVIDVKVDFTLFYDSFKQLNSNFRMS